MSSRFILPLLLAIACAGCGEYSVLELEVDGAPMLNGVLFVQVRPDTIAFAAFEASDDDPPGVSGSGLVNNQISVVTQDPNQGLHIRVRDCAQPKCESATGAEPFTNITIPQPFFLGEATSTSVLVPLQGEQVTVEDCLVLGCGAMGGFSCDGEGRHLCER